MAAEALLSSHISLVPMSFACRRNTILLIRESDQRGSLAYRHHACDYSPEDLSFGYRRV